MKVLILEAKPALRKTNIDAHARNAFAIRDYLNNETDHYCRILARSVEVRDWSEQWDVILICYASFYADVKMMQRVIENQKKLRLGWITNEYNLGMNSSFVKATQFFIRNFTLPTSAPQDLYVNLNALKADKRRVPMEKKFPAIYYGTFRPGRVDYFKKYLQKGMVISTSPKNLIKYRDAGCDCKYIGKLNWTRGKETLNLFSASLYIEDKKSHTMDCFLADRFYESLYCNTAMFFDSSCKAAIERNPDYHIDDFWVVNSHRELMEKAKEIPPALLEQHLAENTLVALQDKLKVQKQIQDFLEGLL